MFFFSFIFYLFLFYPKHVYEQSYTHFLCFFFLFLLRGVRLPDESVTSTLHFRDPSHNHSPLSPPTTMTTNAIRASVVVKGYVFLFIYWFIANVNSKPTRLNTLFGPQVCFFFKYPFYSFFHR